MMVERNRSSLGRSDAAARGTELLRKNRCAGFANADHGLERSLKYGMA